MYLVPRWADRNLSRLELVSAWILILVLIGTFTRHMLIVFARAEQSMIERTVLNIETALKYEAGMARMQGEYERIKQMVNENPVSHIQSFSPGDTLEDDQINVEPYLSSLSALSGPSSYGGVITSLDPDMVEAGYWYYNSLEGTLIYVIRNTEFFASNLEGVPRLRYKVIISYSDNNGNGEYEPDIDDYRSIDLASMDLYKWLD